MMKFLFNSQNLNLIFLNIAGFKPKSLILLRMCPRLSKKVYSVIAKFILFLIEGLNVGYNNYFNIFISLADINL